MSELNRLSRLERLEKSNELIIAIASCGRKFFRYGDSVAYFKLDENQRLWWIDEYSKKGLQLHNRYWPQKFSHGGTLQALVAALKNYILYDTILPSQAYLGPWDWCGNNDRWGYGDDMEIVRKAAIDLGVAQ